MIETVYIELPFEKITYLDRPEFHTDEKEFKDALTQSMTKYGMKDPVYCWANGKAYGNIIKVIVSDFVKIANRIPIIGCRYINTATSVDVILLNAYPFKK